MEKKNVSEVRILLVGVGGTGVEILKNLVLSGFKKITLVISQKHSLSFLLFFTLQYFDIKIDLDTIELSNLNRQFLYSVEDIQKPKATVRKRKQHFYVQ